MVSVPESKKRLRKYTGVLQFFHNHEHSPDGLNHCHSDGQYAYRIRHEDGNHIISSQVVCGHGRGNKPQWFRFTKRLGDGYDMTSAIRIDNPQSTKTAKIPASLKGSKIIHRHDDGDLTVEHRGTRYVITTGGKVFREQKRTTPRMSRRNVRITRKMPRLK